MNNYNNPIKNAYKDLWKPGSEREAIVKKLLESWGYKVEPYGFMAMSDEYNPEWSDEKGVPDLMIKNIDSQQLFIEVTGTDNIRERSKIWIREHKIQWAKKNPDKTVFCAHVITVSNIIRFIEMTDIDITDIPLEPRVLHGIETNFYIIPWDLVLSKEDMKVKLLDWKNNGKLNLGDFF